MSVNVKHPVSLGGFHCSVGYSLVKPTYSNVRYEQTSGDIWIRDEIDTVHFLRCTRAYTIRFMQIPAKVQAAPIVEVKIANNWAAEIELELARMKF